MLRSILAVVLSLSLAFPVGTQASPAQPRDLRPYLDSSYPALLESAGEIAANKAEVKEAHAWVEAEYKADQARLEAALKSVKARVAAYQKQLEKLSSSSSSDTEAQAAARSAVHCNLRDAIREYGESQFALAASQVKRDNRRAKLDLLLAFPGDSKRIVEQVAAGKGRQRPFGNVEDVGFRKGFENQYKDIDWGRRVEAEFRRSGLLPLDIDAQAQKDYDRAGVRFKDAEKRLSDLGPDDPKRPKAEQLVADAGASVAERHAELAAALSAVDTFRAVAWRVARSSDVKIPLQVRIIWDDDPNAFALPGGLIFINSGLLAGKVKSQKSGHEYNVHVASESEYAGVLAHEVAHGVRRHAHKLNQRAGRLQLLMNAALLAIFILFPPASYGAYYLLQFGLMGIELLLTLELLGVSRDYESEADLLGVQYLWTAGYDATALARFNAKMSENFGYVQRGGWYRTHPPSYERILATYTEQAFLKPKPGATVDTDEFQYALRQLEWLWEKRQTRLLVESADTPRLGGALSPALKCDAAPAPVAPN